jgi:thiamine biosynthesis protein ThiS
MLDNLFGRQRLAIEAVPLRESIAMNLVINGEPRDFNAPLTLAGLVDHLGMKADRVAVELNRSIVARDQWAKTSLAEGDRLEIVHFVGGG